MLKTFKDALTIINNLSVPAGNMGIPRSNMPQIDMDKLDGVLDWLDRNDIGYKEEDIAVRSLRLTQGEINSLKVFKLMRMNRSKGFKTPIVISSDNYVLDGSHRFVAVYNQDERARMKAIKIDLPVMQAFRALRDAPGVRHRSVSGRSLD